MREGRGGIRTHLICIYYHHPEICLIAPAAGTGISPSVESFKKIRDKMDRSGVNGLNYTHSPHEIMLHHLYVH